MTAGHGTDTLEATMDPSGLGVLSLQVQVSVSNEMVAEALTAVAGRGGWDTVARRGPGDVLVTDVAPARPGNRPAGNDVVLVCHPTPLDARRAVDSVSECLAAAVVCADRPGDLAPALDALRTGRVSMPVRVLALASQMPHLTERQMAVLGAVMAGQSNAEIGRGLYLSPASVKRELGFLYVILDSSTRSALVAEAIGLGVVPHAVRP
jgi:DNA-binding CsgD family transcriptional regulator